MPHLTGYATSVLHLVFDDYYKAGLTPEQVETCILRIPDPGPSGGRLWCAPSGRNRNWNVHTSCTDPLEVPKLIWCIEHVLNNELEKRNE